MGSGKSAVGRLLAKSKQNFFLDTDAMIESAEGKSIPKIFEEDGEEYFRSLEESVVSWLINNVNDAVISTGGGMLVYCEKLKEVGKIVYLKVPFETIMSRMDKNELKKRPLFNDLEKARVLYDERNSVYEKRADIIISADASIEVVFSRLRDAVA